MPATDPQAAFAGRRVFLDSVSAGMALSGGQAPAEDAPPPMNDRFQSEFLPLLPLREIIVLPGSVAPLYISREASLAALESALGGEKRLFLASQADPSVDAPDPGDLRATGVVAEILQVLRTPGGASKVLIEGQYAARTVQITGGADGRFALVVGQQAAAGDPDILARQRVHSVEAIQRLAAAGGAIPADLLASIRAITGHSDFVYAAAAHAPLPLAARQAILDAESLEEKYLLLNQALDEEGLVREVERRTQPAKGRYLDEQLKAVQDAARREPTRGESDTEPIEDEEEVSDLAALAESLRAAGMPKEAREKAERELARLGRMHAYSPEAGVLRTWLEWLCEVPWTTQTEDKIDLDRARRILDEDHHGLRRIKERIVEYLAVAKLAGGARGPILCFVGPPGVGKTSLGASIARCIGRRFVRVSLGGVRDEAEIRGHRRTYVGALPGKVIQSMKRAGTTNPVFLLDEIDKMGSDFRGDPASAMLEVLDPQQNRSFSDHYLEVDYDLSRVLFIATANSTDSIPWALLDRMETIRLPGYTDEEKLEIARKHLLPRQRREHGLKAQQLRLPKKSIQHLVQAYTREAGVRALDRAIAQVCRKAAVQVLADAKAAPPPVDLARIRECLGPAPFRESAKDPSPAAGLCLGLAWTEAGGELLPVEVTLMPGKGGLTLTGKLGEVMQESAKTALSWLRANAGRLDIDADFHREKDIHIHIPEGAIPKDGPSAGAAIATALASALAGVAVRQDLAMTGEATLRGRVLRIGGLKEKLLAAQRRKIRLVLVPKDNEDEVEEIRPELGKALEIRLVETLDEVLEAALDRPAPKRSAAKGGAAKGRKGRAGASSGARASAKGR